MALTERDIYRFYGYPVFYLHLYRVDNEDIQYCVIDILAACFSLTSVQQGSSLF